MSRIIVWFSCGAASAIAASIAVGVYRNPAIVYCDTLASEHPDNRRFMRDVERWLDIPITVIRSTKYSSVDEVFERTKYMSGVQGARCTVEMKKVPRFDYQEVDDIHVFGLTADEPGRIEHMEQNNPELRFRWLLRDLNIRKSECYERLRKAGIRLPAMYDLGFDHNNCMGCVKATSAEYWQKTRKYFPAVFERRARQSREIGVRLVRYKGERIYLDELPEEPETDYLPFEDIECGPLCVGTK